MESGHNIFRFACRWVVQGSLADAFHFVSNPRTFRQWFPGFNVESVSSPAGRLAAGARSLCRVRAALPYTVKWDVTVTNIEPAKLSLFVRLNVGGCYALSGTVQFRFRQQGDKVVIDNEQMLIGEHALPGWLHGLCQKVFAWNHRWAMQRGEKGLARILKAGRHVYPAMKLAV